MTGLPARTARWATSTWSPSAILRLCPRTWISSSIPATSTACSFLLYPRLLRGSRPFGDSLSEAVEIPVDVRVNAPGTRPCRPFSLSSLVPGAVLYRADPRRCGRTAVLAPVGPRPLGGRSRQQRRVCHQQHPLALLVTSNLTLLVAQSLTNDDAALTALYPGLVIVPGSTTMSFTNVVTTNLSAYLYELPLRPGRHAAAPGIYNQLSPPT